MPFLHALIAALLFTLFTTDTLSADQDPLPARYDITGAAPLPIYPTPDTTNAALDNIPSDRAGLEILEFSTDGHWARIGRGADTVWAQATRLTRQPDPMATGLPIRCHGLAPFWGFNMPSAFFAEFERAEHPEMPFQITGTASAPDQSRLWAFVGDTATASLLIRNELCTDRTRTRPYGMSAAFALMEKTGAVQLHTGCCTLTTP